LYSAPALRGGEAQDYGWQLGRTSRRAQATRQLVLGLVPVVDVGQRIAVQQVDGFVLDCRVQEPELLRRYAENVG